MKNISPMKNTMYIMFLLLRHRCRKLLFSHLYKSSIEASSSETCDKKDKLMFEERKHVDNVCTKMGKQLKR